MGVYMGYLKLQVYTRLSDRSVLFEIGRIRRQKTELVGSEELKSIVKELMSVVRNHPALCPASTGPICHYTHLLPKGFGHSIYDIIGCGYLL